MIIDNSTSDIQTIGDIQEFKTSIDPKNLDYITTLLSSNLYSAPEKSFIREIVSNAWDSHIEAGTTDTPIIVKFNYHPESKSVTIRDYGVGLSPERFKEMYCNIGSSTKRESNEFIGGFGIGRYSMMACSNSSYITSYYNGLAYHYIMVKSGNTIVANLVNTVPTEEKNGVEITIKKIPNLDTYEQALSYIRFFPNVYIDGTRRDWNNIKIKKLKYLSCASVNIDDKLLLGNVLYPLKLSHIYSQEAYDFMKDIEYTGIVINFNIGEIEVTPNREDIIYSEKTKKLIISRILKAKDELDTLINNKINKDYSSIKEIINFTDTGQHYDLFTDTLSPNGNGYWITSYNIRNNYNYTFKGHNIRPFMNEILMVSQLELPWFKGYNFDFKFCVKSYNYRYKTRNNILCKKYIIGNKDLRVTTLVKSFLTEYYCEGTSLFSDFTAKELFDYYKSKSQTYTLFKQENIVIANLVIDALYEEFKKYAETIDFTTDTEFKKFKEDTKQSKKVDKFSSKVLTIYEHNNNCDFKISYRFNSFKELVDKIKSYKQGVIIGNTKIDIELWRQIAKIKGLVLLTACNDIVKAVNGLYLSCIVDQHWLLYKDPLIRKVCSANSMTNANINTSTLSGYCYLLDYKEYKDMMYVKDLQDLPPIYKHWCISRGEKDEYIEYLCKKIRKFVNTINELNINYPEVNRDNGNLNKLITTHLLLKNKAIRIPYKLYKKYSSNPIIKSLCKK